MLEMIGLQKDMFFLSLVLGAIMGFSYDCIRCFRRVFAHNSLFVAVEDVIYWCLWTFLIIDNFQSYNNGEIRGYIFVGLIVGVVVYLLLFGFIAMKAVDYVLKNVKKCINKLKNALKKGRMKMCDKKQHNAR